eukprot:323247_1
MAAQLTKEALEQSEKAKNMAESLVSELQSYEQKYDSKDVSESRIFVSIINYRDNEGQFTLNDLFCKAANPSRIYIGYCLQYSPETDQPDINYHYNKLASSSYGKNIRTLFVPYTRARGPIYARYLVQNKFYNNEKYYLQIDCHMRFIKNWDNELIKQYQLCNDTKAIITTYPNPYDTQYLTLLKNFINIKDWDGNINMSSLDQRSSLLCADKFGNDGFLRIKSKMFHKFLKKPMLSLFYAAGFNFSLGNVIKNCPQDPNLKCLFFGEESINAVRLYTNGYNFYTPTRSICYHLWNRKDGLRNGVWRELYDIEKLKQMLVMLENKSKKNVKELLKGDGVSDDNNIYGFGVERSLKEYEKFCGVGFGNKSISDDAKYGGVKEDNREELFEEFQQNKLMNLISSFQT